MKKENQPRKSKKKLYIILAILLFVVILGFFFNYRYIQQVRKDSYFQGGNDAITQIRDVARTTGGVILEGGNDTLILAKYEKAITNSS